MLANPLAAVNSSIGFISDIEYGTYLYIEVQDKKDKNRSVTAHSLGESGSMSQTEENSKAGFVILLPLLHTSFLPDLRHVNL